MADAHLLDTAVKITENQIIFPEGYQFRLVVLTALTPLQQDRPVLSDLRAAHDRNDEVLERIYIGRRFRNDTERLEKLFELYTKMTTEDLNKTNLRMKA